MKPSLNHPLSDGDLSCLYRASANGVWEYWSWTDAEWKISRTYAPGSTLNSWNKVVSYDDTWAEPMEDTDAAR